jgi:tetratricopeptide (TPR) repeat protein
MGQSFHYPANPPMDLPKAAQVISKDWQAALLKDDWNAVVRYGSPYLNLQHEPKDGGKDFRFFKGLTYYARFRIADGSGQAAFDSIQKAYQEAPEQGEICFQAGHLLLERDRASEAIKPLQDAVRIYPFPDAEVDLAVALNGAGRYQDALQQLEILDQRFPKNRRIRFDLANCLVSLKRPVEALPILEDLISINRKDVGAQKELAYVLTELQRPKEAIPHLRAAASLVPNDPAPWVEIAYAHLMLKECEAAAKAISEAEHRKASPKIISVMRQNLKTVQNQQ